MSDESETAWYEPFLLVNCIVHKLPMVLLHDKITKINLFLTTFFLTRYFTPLSLRYHRWQQVFNIWKMYFSLLTRKTANSFVYETLIKNYKKSESNSFLNLSYSNRKFRNGIHGNNRLVNRLIHEYTFTSACLSVY